MDHSTSHMTSHMTSHISGLRLRRARFVKKAGAFALIFMISALAMVYVWQRVQVIAMGYQVEDLKKERDELKRVNKGLQIETASLTSPDRIVAIASKDIGMKPATEDQVVLVKRVARGVNRPADPTAQAKAGTASGRS